MGKPEWERHIEERLRDQEETNDILVYLIGAAFLMFVIWMAL